MGGVDADERVGMVDTSPVNPVVLSLLLPARCLLGQAHIQPIVTVLVAPVHVDVERVLP